MSKWSENKEYFLKYLQTHPCVDCGESNVLVLECDHIGPKTFAISRLVKNGSMDDLIKELSHCDVRCANCHRIRHTKNSWRAGVNPNRNKTLRRMRLLVRSASKSLSWSDGSLDGYTVKGDIRFLVDKALRWRFEGGMVKWPRASHATRIIQEERKKSKTAKIAAIISDLENPDLKYSDIAKKHGTSAQYVKSVVDRNGLQTRQWGPQEIPKGQFGDGKRWPAYIKLKIKEEYRNTNKSIRSIATEYGVGYGGLRKFLRRNSLGKYRNKELAG